MTQPSEASHAETPKPPPSPPGKPPSEVWGVAQFVVALAVTTAFLAYLLLVPASSAPVEDADTNRPAEEIVQVAGPGLLRIQPGSPLDKKLHLVVVRSESVSAPVMTVTGRVVASLRPGSSGKESDFWQFDSPELLTAFTDWQKAQADIVFADTQLVMTKEMAQKREEAQKKVIERLERLVAAGTDTPKDLAVEQTSQMQYQLDARKSIHEANSALRVAKRSEAALSRQLQQAGLDSDLLRSATSDIDLVQADVPEGMLNRVKIGQGCQAKFFGLPKQLFTGKVKSIAPVLSKERRSLRVLFAVDDLKDDLRPGMFAEIGMGTDARATVLVSSDGVLHVGRADYVLVKAGSDRWRVTEVEVGEPRNGDVEILSGLRAGDEVVGTGAILLKPLVVRSLLPSAARKEAAR